METETIKKEDIDKIKADLEIIKSMLVRKDPEGELSDWAKEELERSRAIPESECISHQDVKKMVLEDGLSNQVEAESL